MQFSPKHTFGVYRDSPYGFKHEIFATIKDLHPHTDVYIEPNPGEFLETPHFSDFFRRIAWNQDPTLIVTEALASTVNKPTNCITISQKLRDRILQRPRGIHTRVQAVIIADPDYAWSHTNDGSDFQTLTQLAQEAGIPLIAGARNEIANLIQNTLSTLQVQTVAETINNN